MNGKETKRTAIRASHARANARSSQPNKTKKTKEQLANEREFAPGTKQKHNKGLQAIASAAYLELEGAWGDRGALSSFAALTDRR